MRSRSRRASSGVGLGDGPHGVAIRRRSETDWLTRGRGAGKLGNAVAADYMRICSATNAVRFTMPALGSVAVGAHLPGQHQFGEQLPVSPRQRRAADRGLVFDDPTARLPGGGEPALHQPIEQRGLAGARPTGQDEEPIRCVQLDHYPMLSTSKVDRRQRSAVPRWRPATQPSS